MGIYVIHAEEPWTEHWLPLTNLDLLVPPFDVGSFFCYKKPSHGNFSDILNNLKLSLSRALSLYYPLAGEIKWNEAAGENQFHCNNHGVDFTEAFADVELKELDNPDESIEGKLIPKKLCGVLAIQVTELKCGAIVIGSMFDHRSADGYSANIFISSWADITRSETPSMLPSFDRSLLSPRCPTTYSSSIDDIFTLFKPPTKPNNDENHEDEGDDHLLVNRLFYIESEQLQNLQQLASENGCRRSKLEAFTSFLWKIIALSMEKSGNCYQICNLSVAVDGRSRIGQGDGEEKQKLLASLFGNVLSMPSGSKSVQELKKMPLSDIATEVHEFVQTATRKDHFLDLIDWVADRRKLPLVAKAFADNKEMAFMISSGQRFQIMDMMDFGWGNVAFGSCYLPSGRQDCYVMTLPSPTNKNDWVVYMRLPLKHISYIEKHASQIFKPLNANYLEI